MSHHKQAEQGTAETYEFPSQSDINKFVKISKNEQSGLSNAIREYTYPTALILGAIFSTHYAINPIGNARRMIIENRTNPVLLRVKHALPFVFLGLIYKWADDVFYLRNVRAKRETQKNIQEVYKGYPQLFRE